MNERVYSFIGGSAGSWHVLSIEAVTGEILPDVTHLDVRNSWETALPAGAAWILRGATSHERYVTRQEHDQLAARQAPLGRQEAVCAALIPVKKTEAWWGLPQDERRALFETRSAHIRTGLEYLPAVARRLHHSRDLGEPFDFLTWFEYPEGSAGAFEELVRRLRNTEEWNYVEREVDIRLLRAQ